jgi:hypothetical protein
VQVGKVSEVEFIVEFLIILVEKYPVLREKNFRHIQKQKINMQDERKCDQN